MRIARVKLSNILGIEELEFEAGRFVEIAGPNETGKTSVLKAIRSVLEGGNDATLLRNGAEKGEIVLVLDDDTMIRKRVGVGKGVTVERDGVREKEPQSFINRLHDSYSANPVMFLEAEPKQQVSILLDSLPMKADPARIREIVGDAELEIDEDAAALPMIKKAYDDLFAIRRDTNRAATQKVATIDQLAQTLPDARDTAGAASEGDLKEQLAALDEANEAENRRIDEKLGKMKLDHEAEVDALREEIGLLRAKIAEAETTIAQKKATMAETESRASQQRDRKAAEWRANRQPLVTQMELIQANRDAAVRAETTRANMRTLRGEADKLQHDSELMTKALKALEAYKTELLDALPIPGLVVEEGVVKRNGVVFEHLNEAQKTEIAFDIAKLRAGALGVVCIDGIERIQGPRYDAFKAAAVASGLQLFVTRAVDTADALQINQG